jgi:multidrug efflux system membrane fusion protein
MTLKPSRIAAVAILVAAVAWIGSGSLGKEERKQAALAVQPAREAPRFKVAVVPAAVEMHPRRVVLSGHTEADRRATAVARTSGFLVDLRVRRGSLVKAGDVIAVLSDEAREATVAQAKARLEQRKSEAKARLKLIELGSYAALNRPQLEAELRAAEAGLAQAEAEAKKGEVVAPISGFVNDVPVELGQALQPMMGAVTVAEIIASDPMLAVVEIAERQLGGVKVGGPAEVRLVTGEKTTGTVKFVSKKASAQTRTYRVDVELPNKTGSIPDGVTCEVDLLLAATPAARIPRSALTFSSEGRLGVRLVGEGGRVAFAPVSIVEDAIHEIWAAGIPDAAQVIVQGQDFVKDGEVVEAGAAPGALAAAKG